MALTLILILLFVLIVFFQAMQGLFSALLMAVLTVCCAGLAMGTFDTVAVDYLANWWHPSFAMPLALGLTFGVPLLLLRVAADQMIRRTALLPVVVDRLGGALCGIVTGIIVVGIFSLCVEMIPFDRGSFIGYSRVTYTAHERDPEGYDEPKPADPFKEKKLFPPFDRAVVGLASLFSDGVMSGSKSFRENHPEFIQTVAWNNAVPLEVPRFAPPGSISIIDTAPISEVFEHRPGSRRMQQTYRLVPPAADKVYRRIKVGLSAASRGELHDHFFTLRQFQLFGRDRAGGPLTHYFAIGLQSEDNADKYIRALDYGYGVWPVVDKAFTTRDKADEVDVVFELPRGFRPEYLEYKLAARAEVKFSTTEDEGGAPPPQTRAGGGSSGTVASTRGSGTVPSAKRGGAVRGATARVGASHFGDALPLTLTGYRRYKNAEISRGALVDGHLVAYLADQSTGKDEPVSKLAVPQDKRLLHLNIDNLRARSGIGRILSQAVKSIQNFTVEDDNGKQYQLIGKYAVAKVGNDEVFEVQYFSHQAGSIGGVGKFEKIQDRHLTREYQLVLLFLVDPGAEIVRFSTGGSATRADDLTGEGLVAPK